MNRASFEEHLRNPRGRAAAMEGALIGSAGGGACGDLVRIALDMDGAMVRSASFDVHGCGAMIACGSACVGLVEGRSDLTVARIGPIEIAGEFGGLPPAKLHAAGLVADALHRALTRHWRGLVDRSVRIRVRSDRVVVGMSGGVDSAVAALLAKRGGQDVVAVTLKLWADEVGDEEQSCCSPRAVLGARALAHSMGLPHVTLDMESWFRDTVVEDFVTEHARGRTPSPCVRCNGRVRFDAMLALGDAIGAHQLVTGHYARICSDESGPLLGPAADHNKDQAYMLSALRPELLERIQFPLEGLEKPQVRVLAREAGLPVAEKRESQDLCFIAGTDRESFLERHGGLRERPGEIVDRDGRVVGRHPGHTRYTVGQRRGLGVAAREPLYVLSTDATGNRVVVGPKAALAARGVVLEPATLYRDGQRVAYVKLRYRSEPSACVVDGATPAGEHRRLQITLDADVDGVAVGQVACLLDEQERVIGHGVIEGAEIDFQ